MGLPLYVAPVESDLPGKAAPKSPPAHARSSIRRLRHRDSQAARENRRRQLAAAAYPSGPDPWLLGSRPTYNEPGGAPSTSNPESNNTATAGSSRARESLREFIGGRMAALDARVVADFGGRWASLHAMSNPSPRREEADDEPPSLLSDIGIDLGSTSIRSTLYNVETEPPQRHSRLARLSRSPPPLRRVRSRDFSTGSHLARRSGPRRVDAPRRYEPVGRRLERHQRARFDGLGDRDRSLSPEGDGVWDTLLSTLTPDPQPPSVGSSFASASASAVASQTTAAGSSSTSPTGPDTADESGFEPVCESGCENSDTEGDDDEEAEQMALARFPSGLRHQRSYADVAAHAMSQARDGEDMEIFGGIGGMQRIVRNLARREDIPDEWWAEAGLSRTLSREASN